MRRQRSGILDAPEALIGVSKFISSRDNRPAAVGDAGRGVEVSLLSLRGPSNKGRAITITASALRADARGVEGFAPGIITGILHFGNGGGMARLEFDIPCSETHDAGGFATNGISFSVPAGNVHLLAREDSKIIPKLGQGHPSNEGGALVSASAAYGSMFSESILKKTVFWAWQSLGVGETSERIPIGPFIQDFIFIRYPRSGITVTVGTVIKGGNTILETYTWQPNIDISTIAIPPRATWLTVTNNGPAPIDHGQCVYNMRFYFGKDDNSTIRIGGGPNLTGDPNDEGGSPTTPGGNWPLGPGGAPPLGGGPPGGEPQLLSDCQKLLGVFGDAPLGAGMVDGGTTTEMSHSLRGGGAYLNGQYKVILLDAPGNASTPPYLWEGSGAGFLTEFPLSYAEMFGLPIFPSFANIPYANEVAFVGLRLPTRMLRFLGNTETWAWGPNPPDILTGGSNSLADSQGKNPRIITLNDREIFVCNGLTAGKFNSPENQWSELTFPPSEFTNSNPRNLIGMAVMTSGRVFCLVADNTQPDDEIGQCMVYDPSDNTWEITPFTIYGVREATCSCLPNDKVLICGGKSAPSAFAYPELPARNSAAVYDGASNTFYTVGSLITPRMGHSAITLPNGQVFIVGGRTKEFQSSFFDGMSSEDQHGYLDPTELATTELFNPISEEFVNGPTMANKRFDSEHPQLGYYPSMSLQVIPGDTWRVLIAAGWNSYGPVRNVEVFT